MPSIRRSLIAYFLLLLGGALAGVAILYDRLASEAVQERKAAELQLVQQKLDNRNQDASEKFNSELYLHAKALARELRQKYFLLANRPPDPNFLRKFQISMGVAPLAYGFHPWSLASMSIATNNFGFRNSIFWTILAPPSLDEIVRQSLESEEHSGVYQIHMPRMRQPIRPAGQTISFPFDIRSMDRQSVLSEEHHVVDEVEVIGDGVYRRVIYRPPFWSVRVPRSSGPPRDRDTSSSRGGGPPRSSESTPRGPSSGELQAIYVQYARRKSDLDLIFTTHEQTAAEETRQIIAATQARLSWLRTWLFSIGIIAFSAMLVGGWILIGRGLAPLANLSEAVSRVSPSDFRLPIRTDQLSEELLPIHARLTQTLDALRRAFEREKQSVADISHELRTPLAALQTTIEVSLRKPREAHKYRETLTECREIGQQLNKLVNRILTLANLDAGNDKSELSAVPLGQLVDECSLIIRPLADSHELTYQPHVQPGLVLQTDLNKLREVLLNLLHNAVEYSRPGGTIDLRVQANPDGRSVRFDVSDTGIGMTPEVQSKIFERFFRADASRTATGVHAGLGLSIVQEYLQRLGGTITVASTPDVGTTFTITLSGLSESSPAEPIEAALSGSV